MAINGLTRQELHDLLETAKHGSDRDWLIVLVAYWHGLRISEILALTPDWVKDGFLTVQRLKGSLKTIQPLVPSNDPLLNEAEALPGYLANVPAHSRAFPITRQYFWRVFGRYAEAAGIPAHKRHPHVLKHSIAMHSIESAGIQNVRQHLGHCSMSSTGEYLKVSDEQATAAVVKSLAGTGSTNSRTSKPEFVKSPVVGDRYASAAKKAWETRRAKRKQNA